MDKIKTYKLNQAVPKYRNVSQDENPPLKIIAYIQTDFPQKFGIPRQSGLVDSLKGRILFQPEYRDPDALRGLEEFSHLWLIWEFSQAVREGWTPTVKPPRLGGNTKMGVFATRSPFRPNAIGLSSVKLEKIEWETEHGPILHVSGVDLLDHTPIYDIKPYLPYTDCHPDALGGFADLHKDDLLQVEFPEAYLNLIPANRQEALLGVLANDPRPSYQQDPARVYGVAFAGFNVRFRVQDRILTVIEIQGIEDVKKKRLGKEENTH